MLNDLLAIERGLAAYGIIVEPRHADFADLAKGWAFRVRLARNGQVSAVEIISNAGGGVVWTLRDGKHNAFPGIKTDGALRAWTPEQIEQHAKIWKASKSSIERRQQLAHLRLTQPINTEQVDSWPGDGYRKRIEERLDALRVLADDPLTAAVPAAFERFLEATTASPSFLEQLEAILGGYVESRGDEWIDPVKEALTGPVTLAIDVDDLEFQRDAGDPRQIGPISKALSGSKRSGAVNCSLNGEASPLHIGNFPQPNLPGIGETYIFSRNKEIPSVARYGRSAASSFPVGDELVQRLHGAIYTLTREDLKGKTWRLIPAESGDKPDLLVVSTADPGAHYADAAADDDEVSGEAALKELASRVIDQSNGIFEHGRPEDQVLVLVLRTVDPANRKAIYQRQMTSAEFWKAAQRWHAATANTPDWLRFPFPGKAKAEVIVRGPPYVTPLSITPISRVQFANGGRRPIAVIGIPASQAFQLFLGEGDAERRARNLLRLLVERHGDLLAGVAAARTKGTEYLKDFDSKATLRRDALRSATWIGALLHHIGRYSSRRSKMPDAVPYTEGLGFRFGQLLAITDMIHVGYCMDRRGGDVPPSLMGNSVLAIAGADPVRALAILQSRLKPYLAWVGENANGAVSTRAAQYEQQGNKGRAIAVRRALSHCGRAETIAREMRGLLADYRANGGQVDDSFKAELLLGYMAGLPPTAKKHNGTGTRAEDEQSNEGENT